MTGSSFAGAASPFFVMDATHATNEAAIKSRITLRASFVSIVVSPPQAFSGVEPEMARPGFYR